MYLMHKRKTCIKESLWFFCSQLFCDFGKEFEVLDRDGENPVSAMVQKISKVTHSV